MRLLRWSVLLLAAVAAAPACANINAAEDPPKAETPKVAEATPEVTYAHIEIQGSYPEAAQPAGLFGELSESLSTAVARFEKAAEDSKVHGVILHLNGPSLGWGKVDVLRKAIAGVRAKGKKVHAYLDGAGNLDYLVAAACDEIVMPESGMLTVVGMRAEVSFYKNLFELAGVKAEMLRVGEFKSAAEPYTRSSMSPEFRKEMEEVLDDYFKLLVKTIATSRKLDPAKVQAVIDAGPQSAVMAKEAGLIDRIAYEDELDASLAAAAKAKLKVLKKYGKKKIDTDFSGFGGMMKLMEVILGEEPKTKKSTKPKLAVLYASGAINTGKSGSDFMSGESSLGSETLIEAIREANGDPLVKAIVLRVNSPGGSALASDLMWRELERVEKPFVVSMGDVAASGGYYIAMGADRIFAEPGTLTGSIGVVGGKIALGGLYDKVGVNTEVIVRGKNSGIFSSTLPFTDEERAAMQKMLNDIYAQFTTKAAKGRKMEVEALEKLARGRVYSGEAALKLKLVDELGSLEDAIAYAQKQAGIEPGTKLERLILPKASNPFDSLFNLEGDVRQNRSALLEAAREIAPELAEDLQTLRWMQSLSHEPGLLVMPFKVRFK